MGRGGAEKGGEEERSAEGHVAGGGEDCAQQEPSLLVPRRRLFDGAFEGMGTARSPAKRGDSLPAGPMPPPGGFPARSPVAAPRWRHMDVGSPCGNADDPIAIQGRSASPDTSALTYLTSGTLPLGESPPSGGPRELRSRWRDGAGDSDGKRYGAGDSGGKRYGAWDSDKKDRWGASMSASTTAVSSARSRRWEEAAGWRGREETAGWRGREEAGWQEGHRQGSRGGSQRDVVLKLSDSRAGTDAARGRVIETSNSGREGDGDGGTSVPKVSAAELAEMLLSGGAFSFR